LLGVVVLRFTTEIRIERPVELVFGYVADPERFPSWNPAVRSVRATSDGVAGIGSTYALVRDTASGPAANVLEVVDRAAPGTFAVRAASGPTPFVHRYRFAPAAQGGATIVQLDAEVDVGAFAALSGSLAQRVAVSAADSNLGTLKRLLEGPGSPSPRNT
jgi:uncharacterized protein YndB with AHSA1/START domain